MKYHLSGRVNYHSIKRIPSLFVLEEVKAWSKFKVLIRIDSKRREVEVPSLWLYEVLFP